MTTLTRNGISPRRASDFPSCRTICASCKHIRNLLRRRAGVYDVERHMLEYMKSIIDEPWKPISRLSLAAWLVFYVCFLGYAFSAHGEFLFIDNANLVVHEGEHNLFGWFGP